MFFRFQRLCSQGVSVDCPVAQVEEVNGPCPVGFVRLASNTVQEDQFDSIWTCWSPCISPQMSLSFCSMMVLQCFAQFINDGFSDCRVETRYHVATALKRFHAGLRDHLDGLLLAVVEVVLLT